MKKLFSFRDFDTHYILTFLGIQINIRHKVNFDYKPAVEYGVTRDKRSPQLIVSLTSFPARIDKIHLTINTLLRQNTKPDRVVLWLTESQFPNAPAPDRLRRTARHCPRTRAPKCRRPHKPRCRAYRRRSAWCS